MSKITVERAANGFIVREPDCEGEEMTHVYESCEGLFWHLKESLDIGIQDLDKLYLDYKRRHEGY